MKHVGQIFALVVLTIFGGYMLFVVKDVEGSHFTHYMAAGSFLLAICIAIPTESKEAMSTLRTFLPGFQRREFDIGPPGFTERRKSKLTPREDEP